MPNDISVKNTVSGNIDNVVNILFIADIIGEPGLRIVQDYIPLLKRQYDIHLTIANGENGAAGKGLTHQIAQSYFKLGIDVITSGNHIWNKRSILTVLNEHPYILRPINYPPDCPGKGSCTLLVKQKILAGVINLQGRSFMYPIDCPFRRAEQEIENLKRQGAKLIIIDFHAEATAEKMALGWYLDGRVSAVIGSHTHIQTNDDRILPQGTAYITDAGMTGPADSVIGMDKDVAIERFLTQLPVFYKVADGHSSISGVVVAVNPVNGKSLSIEKFRLPK